MAGAGDLQADVGRLHLLPAGAQVLTEGVVRLHENILRPLGATGGRILSLLVPGSPRHSRRGARGVRIVSVERTPMITTAPGGTLTLADDLIISRMGFGAMQLAGPGVFGPPRDRDAAIAVLREAVELGITHIDTADFYGPV